MTKAAISDYVNSDRLWADHENLGRFGSLSTGGVNRQALSEAEADAREMLLTAANSLNVEYLTDVVGNFFIRLEGKDRSAAPVVTGSHIDSQPTGGKYDGAFGFLAGLETLRAIREANIIPRRPIEVVSWMNEEGSRFAPGMMGSAAFCGSRSVQSILEAKDSEGTTVGEALREIEQRFPYIRKRALGWPIHCYIEAHIEQGRVLQEHGATIGIVTGIQGKRTFSVRVEGQEGHAGTTPIQERKDALLATVRLIASMHDTIMQACDGMLFTVGKISVFPNAPSVIPAVVVFSIDLRAPAELDLEVASQRIAELCAAANAACSVSLSTLVSDEPIEFDAAVQNRIRAVAESHQFATRALLSLAGHDAKHLAKQCPSGMIFIPCKDGVSHSPAEFASQEHVYAGAKVLCDVVWQQANS